MLVVHYAATLWQKARGLLGRKKLKHNQGLFLPHCEQVHTAFMKFDIDVVFVNRDGRVVDTEEGLSPWRMSKKVFGAAGCVEMLAGEVKRQKIKRGDKIISN